MDYCICNSASTEHAIRTLGGYKGPTGIALPGRSPLIAGDSKTPERKKTIHRDGPVRLLSLGNVIPRKGFHHVVRSLSEEPRLPGRLEIAGNLSSDPRYAEKLKKLVKKLKLHRQVHFLGFVSEDEKIRLLEHADFLVVPSDHEGYGIVYLEAMEHGTVPVGSISGGAGEVIETGKNGLLVPPGSPKAIYRAISHFLTHPGEYAATSERAMETWKRHPTWNSTFDTVISEIEKHL
jgi:glycosyltransferase involved in cell wall biosynthesis